MTAAARPGILLLGFFLALAAPVRAAVAPDSPADLRARAQAALDGDAPFEAARLADRWAAAPGISDSDRADALIEGARARAQFGDAAGAESALRQALAARPGDAEASFLLAEAARDRPEEALPLAEQAAKTAASPRRRATAELLAAEIRVDLGDEAGARAALARGLREAPDDLDSLRLAAELSRNEPGAAAAAGRACRAAEAQPDWRRAAADRVCALVLAGNKDYAGAMAVLARALALDPDDLNTYRAMLAVRRRGPDEKLPPAARPAAPRKKMAPAQAKAALAAEPGDLEALRVLEEAERKAGRRTFAADFAARFTAAVRDSPLWQQADAYRLGARQWLELGETMKARACLKRAEELEPESIATERLNAAVDRGVHESAVANTYRDLAEARISLKDPDGARETLDRALAMIPENLDILEMLVELNLSRGRPREALPYAERAVAAARAASPAQTGKKRGADKDDLLRGGAAEDRADLRRALATLARVRDQLPEVPGQR